MWALYNVISYIYNVQTRIKDLAGTISGVPVLGTYLSSPFYYIENKLWYAARYLEYVNSWLDGLVNEAKNAVLGGWSSLSAWLTGNSTTVISIVTGGYGTIDSWLSTKMVEIRSYVLGGFDSIGAWFSGQKELVKSWAREVLPDLDAWFTAQKLKVEDWVVDRFESILDRVFS